MEWAAWAIWISDPVAPDFRLVSEPEIASKDCKKAVSRRWNGLFFGMCRMHM
ncbi:hypothetical protein NBRC3255_0845 [Gluconobacter thailandicus NBRC 3255]|nr:hypothetical protein NBRC3255_0845 [Gluconobacter thailandicus NBRC 3255]